MKRIIIAISLLVFVVSFCIAELIFMKNLINEFKNDIETIQNFVETEEKNKAINKNEEIISNWKTKHILVSTFINHEPLIEIETSLEIMKVNLEKDELEDFSSESKKALILLEHLSSSDMPILGNIF